MQAKLSSLKCTIKASNTTLIFYGFVHWFIQKNIYNYLYLVQNIYQKIKQIKIKTMQV